MISLSFRALFVRFTLLSMEFTRSSVFQQRTIEVVTRVQNRGIHSQTIRSKYLPKILVTLQRDVILYLSTIVQLM